MSTIPAVRTQQIRPPSILFSNVRKSKTKAGRKITVTTGAVPHTQVLAAEAARPYAERMDSVLANLGQALAGQGLEGAEAAHHVLHLDLLDAGGSKLRGPSQSPATKNRQRPSGEMFDPQTGQRAIFPGLFLL